MPSVWYRAGTISVAANSKTVTGTNTKWADSKQGIGPGQMLLIPGAGAVQLYEIASVDSDTKITLNDALVGAAISGSAYAIPVGLIGLKDTLVMQTVARLSYYQSQMDGWQQIMTGTGSITLTAPDGTNVTISSFKKLTDDMAKKAATGANNDITSLSGLTTALSIAQGGTGKKNAGDALAALGGFPATGGTITGDVTLTGSLVSQGFSSNSFQGNTTITGASQNVLSLVTSPNSPNLWLNFQRIGGATGWRMGRADGGGFVLVCDQTSSTAMSLGVNDKIYSTANTTKASDGTLKAASPVIRIVKSKEASQRADIAETGFTWSGAGTVNEEAEGVSISRLDTGVYIVTGSDGLANEGWQMLPPRDPQGSGDLGIVEAEQTESGGLTVKLYKRRYRLSEEGGDIEIVKGDLIDVPGNSWIDIRLTMPEDSAWNKRLKEAMEQPEI